MLVNRALSPVCNRLTERQVEELFGLMTQARQYRASPQAVAKPCVRC
jgi:hypothetical protein